MFNVLGDRFSSLFSRFSQCFNVVESLRIMKKYSSVINILLWIKNYLDDDAVWVGQTVVSLL